MTKAYSVVTYTEISDPECFAAYAAIAGPAIQAAGGRFVTRSEPAEILEGENKNRVVVIEFESVEAAHSAYYSVAYQDAIRTLGNGARRDYRIVPGC